MPLLVGREREQAILLDHLAASLTGRGCVVLIGGEAGIGKTALADIICREAADQRALVLVGRCYDLTETPPYGPWVELFGQYLPTDDLPPLPAAFAERGLVGEVASEAALFHQVQGFLAAVATHRPLVLLLDDLHWADPASLDLLRYLARSLSALPILLIVTYRSDELTRRHRLYQLLPVLERESHAARLALRRLPAEAVRALTARYRLPDADQERLVTHLQARTEGNAFFLTQLLRALEEETILRPDDARWSLGDLASVQVPMPLKQVIDGRFGRLGEAAQHLLAVAAVIGQEAPLSLWATVAGTDEETLLATVERGAAAHLIEETPDGGQARFVHALIRETVYEGTPPSRRRRLHRQVGEALAALANPDPDAVAYHFQQAGDARAVEWLIRAGGRAQRAYSYTTAGERFEAALAAMERHGADPRERAWLLFRQARMERFSDPAKGVARLDEALRWAAMTNDNAVKAYLTFDYGLLCCFTRVLMGMRGNMRRGLAMMEAGIAALDALTAADRALLRERETLEVSTETNDRRGTLALWLASAGRYDEARSHAERVIAERPAALHARTTSAFSVGNGVADAYNALAMVHQHMNRPDDARRNYALAYEAYENIGHHLNAADRLLNELRLVLRYQTDRVTRRHQLNEEIYRAYANAQQVSTALFSTRARISLLLLEGKWVEAEPLILEQYAARVNYSNALQSQNLLARLARARGETERAWEALRGGFLAEGPAIEPGDVFFVTTLESMSLAAGLATETGDLPAARMWLEAYDRWLEWSGAVEGTVESALGWAAYHRACDDRNGADEHARRALRYATDPRQPLALIAAHRLLGELGIDASRFDEATTHLDAALALADACAVPYERALTLLAIAELHVATGDRIGATTLLDESRAILIPLGAKPALARADAISARLATIAKGPPVYPAGLSAREVEVLRLAAGRTNRDIADALFLSEHTVRVHVRNILTKTDTENRAAATAFAMRHGLA